jgi:DNA repair protein RecO
MAGEIVKTEGVCLAVHPWSRTSHIVRWLTPGGPVACHVKGAVRPKSAFLGQYDLNYTCEVLYYARARGELHALRECSPLKMREELRGDYRALALADYMRAQCSALAPHGPDCAPWHALLEGALDAICVRKASGGDLLRALLCFELGVLKLAGLSPELEAESGSFALRGERSLPVSGEVAQCLRHPGAEKKFQILVDAARAIGVFYTFHLDSAPEIRRTMLRMISNNEQGTGKQDD